MPLSRLTGAALLFALLLVGCRGKLPPCPQATTSFEEIPPGLSHTDVSVEVLNPYPDNGLEVLTELTAVSGVFGDPFARETTYTCAHDVSGPVEICVNATYSDGSDGSDGEDEDPSVGVSLEYLDAPHVRLISPLECSETKCAIVMCPEDKNECPVVSSLTVEPDVVPEGGTATIEVVAEDPDDNPGDLVTTLSARHGTISDPNARQATYTCDPDVGGAIEICVVASDGDPSCDAERCTGVRSEEHTSELQSH